MTIWTDFAYLHLTLKKKDISPKELYSDFSYTLAYVTLKYERNRIFHPCREILNLSEFYGQALLTVFFHWMYKMKISCFQESSVIHG